MPFPQKPEGMDSISTEQILNAISELRLEMREGIPGLHTDIAGLHTEIVGLRIRVGRLEAEMSSTKADARETRSAIVDRIDPLQHTIEQLRFDAAVDWLTADTAIKRTHRNQGAVWDVYDLVSPMQQQLRLLAARIESLESRGSAAN